MPDECQIEVRGVTSYAAIAATLKAGGVLPFGLPKLGSAGAVPATPGAPELLRRGTVCQATFDQQNATWYNAEVLDVVTGASGERCCRVTLTDHAGDEPQDVPFHKLRLPARDVVECRVVEGEPPAGRERGFLFPRSVLPPPVAPGARYFVSSKLVASKGGPGARFKITDAGVDESGRAAEAPVFDPRKSVFRRRIRTSDSKSLYDTDAVVDAAFELDWKKVRALDRFTTFIKKNDLDGETEAVLRRRQNRALALVEKSRKNKKWTRPGTPEVLDAAMAMDDDGEVDEIKRAIRANYRTIMDAFDYYVAVTALGTGTCVLFHSI